MRSTIPIGGNRAPTNVRLPRVRWVLVTILTLVGLVVAARRASVLTSMASATALIRNPAQQLDDGFRKHRALTFAHIGPAAVYLLWLPLQFIPRLRRVHPVLHRWNGRLLVLLGIYVATTALIMSFTMAIGEANETAATTVYALLLLAFLFQGYRAARLRRFSVHREAMIRAYGVTLGTHGARSKKRDILRLMLGESMRPVFAGLLLGTCLAVAVSYLLRRSLYGLNAIDGVSFAGVSALFLAIALFAAYVPWRRAMRVDSVVALRDE